MELRHENQLTGITANESENTEEEDDSEEWRLVIVLDGHESEVKSVGWSAGGNFQLHLRETKVYGVEKGWGTMISKR